MTTTSPAGTKTKRSAEAYTAAWTTATSSEDDVEKRVQAFTKLSTRICEDKEKLEGVIRVLQDRESPQAVRLAALNALQAASFSALKFNPCRPDYLTALRSLVEDPDVELRQRVLGILAREQDGYAQQRLLEGLQQPDKALLPPEKALQLLSYDIHADAYPIARDIAHNPPNPDARLEALRLLAADAESAPDFADILRNKEEPQEVRQLAASALHALAPAQLLERARDIVLDEDEDDELRTTSLTALTHFGDKEAVAQDGKLQEVIDTLKDKAALPGLKDMARQFLQKFSK
jgi:hypothetical protein